MGLHSHRSMRLGVRIGLVMVCYLFGSENVAYYKLYFIILKCLY